MTLLGNKRKKVNGRGSKYYIYLVQDEADSDSEMNVGKK
jgi:hypothetical protein